MKVHNISQNMPWHILIQILGKASGFKKNKSGQKDLGLCESQTLCINQRKKAIFAHKFRDKPHM